MGLPELTLRYAERARACGAEIELMPREALSGRLASFVERKQVRIAALPTQGWPTGMREEVAAQLARLGCAVADAGASEDRSRDRLAQAELGVTWCSAFLADTGSLVFPSGAGLGTLASLLPPVHLALSDCEGVRPDLSAYLAECKRSLPSRLTLVTGPSRTGDIEGTMSTGVHGPGAVVHWILTGR